MTQRLVGKSALVTGAGKGIGQAVAESLVREGAAVGVLDVDGAAASAVAQSLSADGARAVALTADLRDPAAVERAVLQLAEAHGGIDIVANVAGVVIYGEAPDFAVDDWDFVLDINLRAAFLTAKYAVPLMRARGGGAIINTASVQAFTTQQSVAAYAASKGGIVALTKALAIDHAKDNIRVNAIAPGSVRTPMLRSAAELFGEDDPEATMQSWGAKHPLGFLIEPSDVANAFAFLASDDARAITGTTIIVDAGLLCALPV